MKDILNNRIAQHLLFWLFYFFIYHFNYRKDEPAHIGLLVTAISLPCHLFFTYTQLYYLVPKFLLRKKILAYCILTLLFAKIAANISWFNYNFISYPLRNGLKKPEIFWDSLWTIKSTHIPSYFAIFMIAGLAVSIKLLKQWYLENESKQQAQKEKLSIELEMLKAQVHPHFLFNTLNNLYSLTLIRSEKASAVVANLSELLRYMLYECNKTQVPLEKEIQVIKKYVELEKLRYGDRIDISMTVDGSMQNLQIAPLLLIPLVENSFKHGVSEQLEKCWINLYFHISENTLNFTLTNSYRKDSSVQRSGGLGLANIQKRLSLIYEGKYDLQFIEDEEMFTVKLKIGLDAIPADSIEEPVFIKKLAAV